jgi:hypothetical protein
MQEPIIGRPMGSLPRKRNLRTRREPPAPAYAVEAPVAMMGVAVLAQGGPSAGAWSRPRTAVNTRGCCQSDGLGSLKSCKTKEACAVRDTVSTTEATFGAFATSAAAVFTAFAYFESVSLPLGACRTNRAGPVGLRRGRPLEGCRWHAGCRSPPATGCRWCCPPAVRDTPQAGRQHTPDGEHHEPPPDHIRPSSTAGRSRFPSLLRLPRAHRANTALRPDRRRHIVARCSCWQASSRSRPC